MLDAIREKSPLIIIFKWTDFQTGILYFCKKEEKITPKQFLFPGKENE